MAPWEEGGTSQVPQPTCFWTLKSVRKVRREPCLGSTSWESGGSSSRSTLFLFSALSSNISFLNLPVFFFLEIPYIFSFEICQSSFVLVSVPAIPSFFFPGLSARFLLHSPILVNRLTAERYLQPTANMVGAYMVGGVGRLWMQTFLNFFGWRISSPSNLNLCQQKISQLQFSK